MGKCLSSRESRFRLRSLARFDGAPADGFDEAATDTLAAICDLLDLTGDDRALVCLRLLGDVEALTARFMKTHGTWVFLFHPGEVTDDPAYEHLRAGRAHAYERLFVATRLHAGELTPNERERVGFKYYGKKALRGVAGQPLRRLVARRVDADAAVGALTNVFGLELLQLRLWLLGHYDGEVDGDWGPMSFRAFDDFLAEENEEKSNAYRRLDDGRIAINLRYALKVLLPRAYEAARRADRDDADSMADALFDYPSSKPQWDVLEESVSRTRADAPAPRPPPPGTRRRGRRRKRRGFFMGLFAAVGRVIRRAVGVLAKAAKRLFEGLRKLRRAAVSVFRHGLARIRRVIEICGTAVRRFCHWLLRRPIVSLDGETGAVSMTVPARDHDRFSFVSDTAPKALLTFHRQLLHHIAATFRALGGFAVHAIALVRRLATFGWLRLAWRLVGLARTGFIDRIRERLAALRLPDGWDARFSSNI